MIYISTPSETISPEEKRANVKRIIDGLMQLGIQSINPLNLGIEHLPETYQRTKRAETITMLSVAIFLQKDWKCGQISREEFEDVCVFNKRYPHRPIRIYYEEANAFNDIKQDIRDCLIFTEIQI
jgi:hypothetical protein